MGEPAEVQSHVVREAAPIQIKSAINKSSSNLYALLVHRRLIIATQQQKT